MYVHLKLSMVKYSMSHNIGPRGTSIELSVSVLLDVERVLPEKSGGSHES